MPNPNNPAQDTYNPPSTGADWEENSFSEINPGEIFRLSKNPNDPVHRKENDNQAMLLSNMTMVNVAANTKVYIRN